MQIIKAESSEQLQECADIWLESSIAGHDFIPEEFWRKSRAAMLNEYLPSSVVHLAIVDGSIAGFSATCGDTLASLFCRPAFWGRGAGNALLRHLFTLHQSLELAVYAKNSRAIAFYEKYGFRQGTAQTCAHTGEVEFLMRWECEL